MFKIFFFFLFLNFCFYGNEIRSEEGGIKIEVSYKGLEFISNILLDSLNQKLLNKKISDVNKKEDDFEYHLKNIKIRNISKPKIELKVNEVKQMATFSFSDFDLHASLDWNYHFQKGKFLNVKDSGGIDFSLNEILLSINLKIGWDQESGKATIATEQINCEFSEIESHVTGSTYKRLYENFLKILSLGDSIEDYICEEINFLVNEKGSRKLKDLKVENKLEYGIIMDSKLVAPPKFANRAIHSFHSGCFKWPQKPNCSIEKKLEYQETNRKMVGIAISEESINQYGEAFFSVGKIKGTITKDNLDEEQKNYLDTNCKIGFCMVSFLPSVASSHPNSFFEIDFKANNSPFCKIFKSKIFCNFNLSLYIFVKGTSGQRINLFSVKSNITSELQAKIEKNYLKYQINNFTSDSKVFDKFDDDIVEKGIQIACKFAERNLVKKLNKKGNNGLALINLENIDWLNPNIYLNEGYLFLETDLILI